MVQVLKVEHKADGNFTIHKGDGTSEDAMAVIIATGSTPKRAGFKGEDLLFGKGVSTCATCDGFFYKNKEVAVIGGGDTALEETIFLSNICSKVYLVHRRDKFRAAPNTIERVKKLENVEFVLNASIVEAYGDAMGVAGLKVSTPEGERDLPVPGIFTFVGMNVNNQVLKQEDGSFICDVNEAGEVIVDLRMRTSTPGLYAAGDIRIDAPKQVVCAAGDGAVAAVNVIPYLDEKVNG
jgi:thioredoxin reductase (NADPH)